MSLIPRLPSPLLHPQDSADSGVQHINKGAWKARMHATLSLMQVNDFFRQQLALYAEAGIQVGAGAHSP